MKNLRLLTAHQIIILIFNQTSIKAKSSTSVLKCKPIALEENKILSQKGNDITLCTFLYSFCCNNEVLVSLGDNIEWMLVLNKTNWWKFKKLKKIEVSDIRVRIQKWCPKRSRSHIINVRC